jgi:hypothetical protein
MSTMSAKYECPSSLVAVKLPWSIESAGTPSQQPGTHHNLFDNDVDMSCAISGPSGFLPLTTMNMSYYSTPPSPTRISSISRFSTPVLATESQTPSLLQASFTSTTSSPSLALTPMQYVTTRNPDSSQVGLGLSGLFFQDGSPMDGIGALSQRDDSLDMECFMNEMGGAQDWYGRDSFAHPEQIEDAWRKRLSCQADPGVFDMLKDLGENLPAISPPEDCGRKVRQASVDSPTLPSVDDVFYSHVPVISSTPQTKEARAGRKRQSGLSHAMMTNWSKNVQLAQLEDGMTSFY